MVNITKRLTLIKITIILVLFYGALRHENALTYRTINFMILVILYLSINLMRSKIKNNNILFLSYIIEIGIISLMEYNSRYLVNYLFHLFYFLTLLHIPFNVNKNHSLILSIVLIIISSMKFVILLYNKPIFGNLAQSIFFILTGVFIAFLMNFLKYYKDEKESKEKLNKELLETREKLERVAIIEERNRIARDLHDTIGHSMTGTIMGLDMVEVLMDEDLPKAKGMIEHLKDNARDNLVQVRQVVNTLDPNQNVSKGLDSINELIDSYSFKSNVDINFKVKGNIIKLNPAINIVLYRTIQEGLTNAIRHSECSKIDINLEFYNTHIDLKIKDDGIGSNNTGQGYGLQSMEDRVLSIGGNILFLPDEGFEILINIPLEVSND